METALIATLALLGAAVGSFLNVCIDRLPAGKSLLRPPSSCDACQRRLRLRDLIPVISFLWLRRRCRHCEALIPWRVLWVEAATAVMFAFLYWYYGLGVELTMAIFYSSLFIVLLVIDLEHRLILNRVVFPAAVTALLVDGFVPPGEIFGLDGTAEEIVMHSFAASRKCLDSL